METLWNLLFGCWHRRTSLPFTARENTFAGVKAGSTGRYSARNSASTGTYIVCLDCGKHIPYSWEEMRVLKRTERAKHGTPSPQGAGAATGLTVPR